MSKKLWKCAFFSLLFLLISFQTLSSPEQIQPGPDRDLLALEGSREVLKPDLDYGEIPLYFIPNEGQVHADALFYTATPSYTLWMTRNGLAFDSMHKGERDVSILEFVDAEPSLKVAPIDPTQHMVSYFAGNDRSRWKAGIRTSAAVLYQELYPHIDLKVYGVEREIEYDFIVKPNGEVSSIGFEYRDVEGIRLDDEGSLIIQTGFGELKHTRPIAYQMLQHEQVSVEVEFKTIGPDAYGFEVGEYDTCRDLIIDPKVIVYSTYLGGSDYDRANDIAVDVTGAVYLTGQTSSKNFPTKNALYPSHGDSSDAFVSKLSPNGKDLVYSTYLAGSMRDLAMGIEVDAAGAAYVAGITSSEDFPTMNPIQEKNGIADTFIAKINPTGTALEYATHLGGSVTTLARSLTIDARGSAYVVGFTRSPDFPTKKAFQKKLGGEGDCYLTKLNPAGTAWEFSTFIGGASSETPREIKVDAARNIYICGETLSEDFPTFKAFQKKKNGTLDAFVLKLNRKGKKLLFSTFLGGSADEKAYGLDVDMSGNAVVTGYTISSDFPVVKPLYGTYSGDNDMFLAKFNRKGRKLLFSTYIGGPKYEDGLKVSLASDKTIYVLGHSESNKFPKKNALIKRHQGEGDVVLLQMTGDGQELLFSTFLGGSEYDAPGGMVVDLLGSVYVTGLTESDDFPLKNAFRKKKKKFADVFVTKLEKDQAP